MKIAAVCVIALFGLGIWINTKFLHVSSNSEINRYEALYESRMVAYSPAVAMEFIDSVMRAENPIYARLQDAEYNACRMRGSVRTQPSDERRKELTDAMGAKEMNDKIFVMRVWRMGVIFRVFDTWEKEGYNPPSRAKIVSDFEFIH